jgi:hypothetical protein
MDSHELEREITSMLIEILDYIGADTKYATYASLHTCVEQLIKKARSN